MLLVHDVLLLTEGSDYGCASHAFVEVGVDWDPESFNADRECRISDINKHCVSSLPTYTIKVIPTLSLVSVVLLIILFTNHLQ